MLTLKNTALQCYDDASAVGPPLAVLRFLRHICADKILARSVEVSRRSKISLASELRLGAVSGGKIQTEFFALCGIIIGSQQRSNMRLVSKLLKDFASFRTWREAQSSIRIQEGPPTSFLSESHILTVTNF